MEGDTLTFQVMIERPQALEQTFRYRYAVRPGTARERDDYEPIEDELAFGPNQNTLPVNVVTRADQDDTGDRTLTLVVFADEREVARAIGTITDRPPEPAPRVAIEDATATEGGLLRFRVSIDRPAAANRSYRYRYFVTPGTAVENVDYQVGGREVSFGPGETERWIEIQTLADGVVDGERTLTVLVVGGEGPEVRATGTITNADLSEPPNDWTLEIVLGAILLGAALIVFLKWRPGGRESSVTALLPEAGCTLPDGDPPAVEGGTLPFAAPIIQIAVEVEQGSVEPPGMLPILEEEKPDE